MKEHIADIEYTSLLYDFYGALLARDRREIMDLYHDEDLSLAEIAEEQGLTRQGVHYTLKKAEAELEHYEAALGLVRRFRENRKLLAEAERILEDLQRREGQDRGTRAEAGRLAEILHILAE